MTDPTRFSIFAGYPRSSCHSPSGRTVDERVDAETRDPGGLGGLEAESERELLDILRAPPSGTTRRAFQEKEYALGAAFSRLTPRQAWALHRRLANPGEGDALAMEFARLVSDRRHRLLDFLADARRRAAIETARCR
jgi:hypothetical protein